MNNYLRVCKGITRRDFNVRTGQLVFAKRDHCAEAKEVIVKTIRDKVEGGCATEERRKWLVPEKPARSVIDRSKLPERTRIDAATIALLERLSLVDCANRRGIDTLEEAIAFADQIRQVNTDDVEPLITVLEDKPLVVREDVVTEGNCREDILSNASVTEDEYFIAPPGNIPLEPRGNLLHEDGKL